MYIPLGVNFLNAWNVPQIQPDRRVASPASHETRKIKRGITKRYLKALCCYEEELLKQVNHNIVETFYNQLGLPMAQPKPVNAENKDQDEDKDEERGNVTGAGTVSEHNADYRTIQLARSRFHPVKEVREQAAANLVIMDRQEMEEWMENTANWAATAENCDNTGNNVVPMRRWMDNNNSVDNSDGNSGADSEWPDDYEDQAQWDESDSSGIETEDEEIASSEDHQDQDYKPHDCADCSIHFSLPSPLPSELESPPTSSVTLSKREPTPTTEYSSTGQEESDKRVSTVIENLAMVLNDKRILTVYLAGIEEGIKEARKIKAGKGADRGKAGQRPTKAQRQNGKREREDNQKLSEEEEPLRWFEFEKIHVYDESSGQWALTVERRGRNYRLARASDTGALDRMTEKIKNLGIGNQDWNTGTVPEWADATGSGWFD
ncbi:hypothetical protein VP1G_09920 [Cytospora mali]|uniref:Uncharacterized protein n=1 Tax=Cytospora mali TaxID=578113 RepID=A0A194VFM0_CYTMA|nr:hypothetical protein VP1G_09920 [Valsa mali var. pyri (nom. inval.)]